MSSPTLRQTVEGLTLGFDPHASHEAAVLEFEGPGERPPFCHLVVDQGTCRFAVGRAPQPTVRLRTDTVTLRDIGAGKLDVGAAIANGRLAAEGDTSALRLLGRCFHRVEGEALRDPVGRPPGAVRLPGMAWMAVAFAPWEALWLALALHHPRAGALLALGLACALVAYRKLVGALTFLEAGSALALTGAAILPLDRLPAHAVLAASFAALAAIWALGTATRPLGLSGEYSRWKFLAPVSGTALFRHPNVVISLAWAGGFLANAIFEVARSVIAGRTLGLLHGATFAICAAVTWRYERSASSRRVDDIDRRIAALRRLAWLIAAAAMVLVGVAVTRGALRASTSQTTERGQYPPQS